MLQLDKKKILDYQKNRDPFLMIDFAEKIIPGKLANGYKKLKVDEWFFKVHWPGDPNMPGLLQIEALVQMSALSILTLPNNKGKAMYLSNADDLVFKKKIVPGDLLNIETNVISWSRGIGKFEGIGTVDNEIACKAKFNLILPDEFNKYVIKKK